MIFIETSAKFGDNVKTAFTEAALNIYQKIEDNTIDLYSDSTGIKII
jgi:GTPase SAR1 family protein